MLNPQPGARLAVWGDPIAHSRSPILHAAAYRVLDLDWTYDRRRVSEQAFRGELRSLSPDWRGLSLTMPLKGAASAAARARDRASELTGAVNTLLLTPDGPYGFNTDIGGLALDLTEHGLAGVGRARIVGAGATATSALVALSRLGVGDVRVAARRPDAAAPLVTLGDRVGIRVTVEPLTAPAFESAELTVATLPGDAPVPGTVAETLAASGGALYDVVYGTWPTPLAEAWQRAGGPAVSGIGMLLHQALLQVRVFAHGRPDEPLTDEPAVLAAMRDAVMGD